METKARKLLIFAHKTEYYSVINAEFNMLAEEIILLINDIPYKGKLVIVSSFLKSDIDVLKDNSG